MLLSGLTLFWTTPPSKNKPCTQIPADACGSGSANANHYSYLRSGATDGVLRAMARVTLGRPITMKQVVAARKWFVAHHAPSPRPDAKYRFVGVYMLVCMRICMPPLFFPFFFRSPHPLTITTQRGRGATRPYHPPPPNTHTHTYLNNNSMPRLIIHTPHPHTTTTTTTTTNSMLCLAWAGGNSALFKSWRIPDVEILAVELPGRNA